MPPRKGKLIVFPSRPTETSLEPPPAAGQGLTPQPVVITRSVSRNCLPGVRRRLYLSWLGIDDTKKRAEHELARRYGVHTADVMRMVREEAREEHRQLFFARKAA